MLAVVVYVVVVFIWLLLLAITEVRLDGLKCGRSCRCGGGISRGWRVGDARPSILAPNRSYPLPPLFPLFPIMILTKTRISLGLPPPNPAYHLAWVHRAVYPLAWDPQTPHIPWLGIPKPRISLGLGFPKPEYPLAWDSQNPHIPWLRFSLFSRFSFFAQIGIAAPLVEPAPQRRLPHTQLRSHFNPSSLTSKTTKLRSCSKLNQRSSKLHSTKPTKLEAAA